MSAARPLPALTVAFALGILLASCAPSLLGVVAVGALLSAALYVTTRRLLWLWGLVLTLFALLGAARYQAATLLPRNDISRLAPAPVILTGRVLSDVRVSASATSAHVGARGSCLFAAVEVASGSPAAVHTTPVSGNVELQLPLTASADATGGDISRVPQEGDLLTVHGVLELPSGQRNPGGFDYGAWLARRDARATLTARRQQDWTRIGVESNPVLHILSALRQGMLAHVRATLPRERAGALEGLLLGTRSDLPPELAADFRRTGTSHLLATAGLHVGLVIALLLPLWRVARIPRRAALLLTIAMLILYAVLAGGRPSVVRAVMVAGITLLGMVLEREPDLPNALSLAALCLLLYDPRNLSDPGFQLSFATVITIVLLLPLVTDVLRRIGARREASVLNSTAVRWARRSLQGVVALLCLTIAAQIGVAPLAAYYEYELSPVALLANALAVPVAPPLLAAGFGGAICNAISPWLARPFDFIANGLLAYLIHVVRACAALSWGGMSVVPPPVALIIGYYAVVWGMALWLRRRMGVGREDEKSRSGPDTRDAGHETSDAQAQFANVPGKEIDASDLEVSTEALTAGIVGQREKSALLASGKGSVAVLLLLLVGGHLALFGWSRYARRHDGVLRVTFLDVGQGDAAVLEMPGSRVIVVDTGGIGGEEGEDEGSRVVAPFLRYRGYDAIDALILTHPHADHIGGAPSLLRDFKVAQLLDNGQDTAEPEFLRVLEAARDHGVAHSALQRGATLDCPDGVTMQVLAPTRAETWGTANNASVVLQVQYGRTHFLLTGDAEAAEEANLLQNEAAIGCDVLKAGHHGSRTSTTPEFLAAAHPQWVVVSVGAHNLYGHPNLEVLSRLHDSGVTVYRTDLNGAVTCRSNGTTVQVQPLHPYDE